MADPAQRQAPTGGGLISYFLGHRVAPNLLALIMAVAGLLALTRINTQFFPTTEIPTITIQVVWPGASAKEISDSIVDIVEPEVRFIDGIDKVTTYTVDGLVRLSLEFKERTDMQRALSDVESRMATITTLPQDSERPVITRVQLFEIVGQIALSGPLSETGLQEIAKTLRDRLLNAGIERVTLTGKRDREIWVELPAATLQQLNLSGRDVADRIAVVSQDLPLGNLEGGVEKQLRARGRMTTAEGVASIELRAFETGQKILVRDVAVVRESHEEAAIRHFQGRDPGIILNVQRAVSGDTLRSMQALNATVAAVQSGLQPTVRLDVFDVRAKIVQQRIDMLALNAIQGFTIVVIVLLLFLSFRVAFWVALGVPVALLATFALMWATGQTINAISLVALILVLGTLVDDAIVVGEDTVTRIERGATPAVAAEGAARRMFLPVFASTLTTQAAFLPILLISGVIGQILSAIPFVIVVALVASLLECFLTLPSHLMHTLEATRARAAAGRGALRQLGVRVRGGIDRGVSLFRRGVVLPLVTLAFRWRYVTVTLGIAGVMAAAALMAGGRVGFTFFPTPEPESVYANITFTPGVPEARRIGALEAIEASARRTEQSLLGRNGGRPLIVTTYTTLGQQEQSRGETLARVEVELTPGEERSVRTQAFVDAWRRSLSPMVGIDSIAVLGRRTGPPGFDVDVRLTGQSLEVLKRAALDLRGTMSGIAGLVGLDDDLPYGKSEVILELTSRGQALGFTTQSVATQVRGFYQGTVAVRFARGDEEVTVRVRTSEADRRRGLGGLMSLNLRSPTGGNVALSEVVRVVEQQAFSVIQRIDGKVAVSVRANVDPAVSTPDQVLAELRASIIPVLESKHGIATSFEGRAETQRRAFADLRIGALVALTLIYLVLVFVFQRWLQPLLVMAIIPFGFIGMVVGHYAMGFNLALFSFVGLLGLSGITVNGAIVLIDRMNERIADGEAFDQAAINSAGDRLRALLLTTLTTIGGMAPLLLETSLQAQFLIPIAITLSWGLGFATVLLLFLLPAMIGIAEDVRRISSGIGSLLGLRLSAKA